MEHQVRIHFVGTALAVVAGLGVSVITSTVVASRAYRANVAQRLEQDQTIVVKGSARRRIHSDLAGWSVTVRAEKPELAEAFKVLDEGVGKVREFLASRGFQPGELLFNAISTETIYERDKEGNTTDVITGYRLERRVSITTSDVNRVFAAAGDVTQLIEGGVFVVSQWPEYYYTKISDVKVAIMGEASKDARARAEEIAQNAGCRVGAVRDAQMGVLQITRPNSTDVASYGIYDTSTIEKDVQAVVTVTFGVEKA